MKLLSKLIVPSLALVFSTQSFAAAITCGGTERVATLDSAIECHTGLNNPQVSDINTLFGGSWSNYGELTSNGTNGDLTVTLDTGYSWNDEPIVGSWEISSSFWNSFNTAVISMHVGNGNGDPDFFAWRIETGETSGTFNYDDLDNKGGGLSNLKLWGSNAVNVPEPGNLALLALGLLGLGLARRSVKA